MRRIALLEERLAASLTYGEILCSGFRSLLEIRNKYEQKQRADSHKKMAELGSGARNSCDRFAIRMLLLRAPNFLRYFSLLSSPDRITVVTFIGIAAIAQSLWLPTP